MGDKWALRAGQREPAPEGSNPTYICPDSWLRHCGWSMSCSRRPEMWRGPRPSLDTWQAECGYFFRRVVWEPLLQLLGAGAAWSAAAPGSFLSTGLCFSSLGGG